MREILFRARHEDTNEWLYGHFLGDAIMLDDGTDSAVDINTVGQFTGFVDSKGCQIFEGDIIKTNKFGVDDNGVNHAGDDTFEVKFRDGSFKLENKARMFNFTDGEGVEIVGNVHPVIEQERTLKNTYYVPTKFVFSGTFGIKAESQEQAEEYVQKHCGLVLGGEIHSSLPDDEVDWEFGIHPETIVCHEND